MVAVITAALASSAAGLLAAVASNHSLAAALLAGAARRGRDRLDADATPTQAGGAQLNIDVEAPNASEDRGQVVR